MQTVSMSDLLKLKTQMLMEEGGVVCKYCHTLAPTMLAYGVLHFDEHLTPSGARCPMSKQYASESTGEE